MRVALALPLLITAAGCLGVDPTPSSTPSPSISPSAAIGDPRLGIGEPLIALLAGAYPTRREAETAAAERSLGDVHGFFVDEARHYQPIGMYAFDDEGLRHVGAPGPFATWPQAGWVVLTAFRTRAGAEMLLPRIDAAELEVGAWQVVKRGGGFVGLGQEPHPDGSGPLLGPLPDQALYQR